VDRQRNLKHRRGRGNCRKRSPEGKKETEGISRLWRKEATIPSGRNVREKMSWCDVLFREGRKRLEKDGKIQ